MARRYNKNERDEAEWRAEVQRHHPEVEFTTESNVTARVQLDIVGVFAPTHSYVLVDFEDTPFGEMQ